MLIQLIIIQVVTFIAIVVVLRKLLYSDSAKEALRLRKLKEEVALKQKELEGKIEEAENAYKEKMAEAEEVARAFYAKSEKEAEDMKQEILNNAKGEADGIVKAALNAKEKMREEIAHEMREKAPIMASKIFREILSPMARELAHKELIRDVIDKIQKTEKAAFKARVEKMEIVSAYPLAEADKLDIASRIHHLLGYEVPVHEKGDSKITAGIIIKLGAILIDGSLENKLRQVEKEMDV